MTAASVSSGKIHQWSGAELNFYCRRQQLSGFACCCPTGCGGEFPLVLVVVAAVLLLLLLLLLPLMSSAVKSPGTSLISWLSQRSMMPLWCGQSHSMRSLQTLMSCLLIVYLLSEIGSY